MERLCRKVSSFKNKANKEHMNNVIVLNCESMNLITTIFFRFDSFYSFTDP